MAEGARWKHRLEKGGEVERIGVKHQSSAIADCFEKKAAGHASEVAPGAAPNPVVDLCEEHQDEKTEKYGIAWHTWPIAYHRPVKGTGVQRAWRRECGDWSGSLSWGWHGRGA